MSQNRGDIVLCGHHGDYRVIELNKTLYEMTALYDIIGWVNGGEGRGGWYCASCELSEIRFFFLVEYSMECGNSDRKMKI